MGPGFESLKVHHPARWSSGQDASLSRWNREFDSPTGHQLIACRSYNSADLIILTDVSNTVGVYGGEGPPVPIPNTVVKLAGAENTWLETARENSS